MEMRKEPIFAEHFKIEKITDSQILFTNGKRITYHHDQECCEQVYADFEAIDDLAMEYEFYEPIKYEPVEGFGFRFGNWENMVSVPCYNIQNGYYSSELEIRFHGFDICIEQVEKENDIE